MARALSPECGFTAIIYIASLRGGIF